MYKNIIRSGKSESWLVLILLSLIWGSSFILIKEGLKSFSPSQSAAIRISSAFLCMLPFAIRHFKKVQTEKYKYILMSGVFGNLIPAYLFSLAETKLESSVTGMLNALTPLFTLIIAVYIFKYKIKFIQFLGIIIAFAGTIILSFINSSGKLSSIDEYVFYVIIATVFYAVSVNVIGNYLGGIPSIVITSVSLLFVGPFSLIYLLSTDFLRIISENNESHNSLTALLVLGVIGTAFALILYTYLIQKTSVFFAGTVTYLIPVVAIFWGVIDGENLFPIQLAGLCLILLGVYFVNKSDKKIKI